MIGQHVWELEPERGGWRCELCGRETVYRRRRPSVTDCFAWRFPPAPLPPDSPHRYRLGDAMRRISVARREGWRCGLDARHCRAIKADVMRWVREYRLPLRAAERIVAAARRNGGGAVLGRNEVAKMRLPSAL